MSSVATDPRMLIKEVIEKIEDPSPEAVARVVIDQLDDEQLRHFAIRGIAERVREIAARNRKGGARATSARWTETARQHGSGELDLARIAIFNGEMHKWLLDCSADDLDLAAVEQERQADALRETGAKYTKLAGMLRHKRGATVVRDLGAEKVRSVLNA